MHASCTSPPLLQHSLPPSALLPSHALPLKRGSRGYILPTKNSGISRHVLPGKRTIKKVRNPNDMHVVKCNNDSALYLTWCVAWNMLIAAWANSTYYVMWICIMTMIILMFGMRFSALMVLICLYKAPIYTGRETEVAPLIALPPSLQI